MAIRRVSYFNLSSLLHHVAAVLTIFDNRVIRDMIRLEKALDECLEKLKGRLNNDFHDDYDDVDSIASGGLGSTSGSGSIPNTRIVRFSVEDRRVEKLQAEVSRLEEENARLRQQVHDFQRKMVAADDSEEKKHEDKDMVLPSSRRPQELSERHVWSVVKSSQAHL